MTDGQRAVLLMKDYADKRLIPLSAILGPSREQILTRHRQNIMWRIRTEIGLSYPHIGKIMNRHHTTVIHGVQVVQKMKDGKNEDTKDLA